MKYHWIPYSSFHVVLENQLLFIYTIQTGFIYSGWAFSCFLTSGAYASHPRKCLEKAARRGQTLKAMPNMESDQMHTPFYFCLQHKTPAQRIMLKKGFYQNILASYKTETNFLGPFLVFLCCTAEHQHNLNCQGFSQFCMLIPGCDSVGKVFFKKILITLWRCPRFTARAVVNATGQGFPL